MLAEIRSRIIVRTDCGKVAARPPENFSNLLATSFLSAPQLFTRQPRAFGHGFEFRPADLWAADPRAEAAIGAGHDVFAADDFGVAHVTVGDRLRMFDDVRGVTNDAGNEHFAFGQLHFFPNA